MIPEGNPATHSTIPSKTNFSWSSLGRYIGIGALILLSLISGLFVMVCFLGAGFVGGAIGIQFLMLASIPFLSIVLSIFGMQKLAKGNTSGYANIAICLLLTGLVFIVLTYFNPNPTAAEKTRLDAGKGELFPGFSD